MIVQHNEKLKLVIEVCDLVIRMFLRALKPKSSQIDLATNLQSLMNKTNGVTRFLSVRVVCIRVCEYVCMADRLGRGRRPSPLSLSNSNKNVVRNAFGKSIE